jgi:hypothetical protein
MEEIIVRNNYFHSDKSFPTINGAKNRLDDIIPPAIREVLNSYNKNELCDLTSEETATIPVKQKYK